jgi:hypothetical protein
MSGAGVLTRLGGSYSDLPNLQVRADNGIEYVYRDISSRSR